jgi:CO/xanthine dehydrogenase FAD-binding subunit
MKPAAFDYIAPGSVEELLQLIADREDAADTAILAGGQSLMPLVALRHATPSCLIDINGLESELGQIELDGGGMRLGALVRQRTAERDARIAERVPLLAEALPLCAKPAIRTRGTIGGSLAYADPAAEIPLVALALDAEMAVSGPRGDRVVPAAGFYTGACATALAADELLSAVVFPDLPEGTGTAFVEISARYADRAIAAAAAAVTVQDGSIARARVGLGGVAATPVRARRAEAALTGQRPDAELLRSAAAIAAEDVDPSDDLRASAGYRKHVVGVLARRALTTAIERAGGAA